jgi:oxygen-dependent protoporphyrinogen oxidase
VNGPPRRVAVVGAGITGLAAAWFVRQKSPGTAVTIVEASGRVGGKVQTAALGGAPVEAGPDTFLARVPWAVELCRQLGLEDDLVAPATSRAYVWTRGRLRPLPAGLVLGVPARVGPLARSGIVSPLGLARAGLDLVLPRRRLGADPSVADVVGGRFGREVVDRLVEPLLGGIHAGRADRLSLASVAPQVAAAAETSRSLLIGLRRQDAAAKAAAERGGPVFLSIRGGLERLVERLRDRLEGVDLRLDTRASSLVDLQDGVGADAIIVTVPAFAAAPLVRPFSADAAAELDRIEYASVVTATLAYPRRALSRPLDGSGFLVPRVDRHVLTACTWSSSKWAGTEMDRASDVVLLRASAGRIADERAMALTDEALVERVHRELVEAMGLRGRPVSSLVTRWPRALPQYDVGHRARVARIEAALTAAAPHVRLAGAAYRGVGIAACVRQAEEAAAAVVGGTGSGYATGTRTIEA